jgi:hypothetical protein
MIKLDLICKRTKVRWRKEEYTKLEVIFPNIMSTCVFVCNLRASNSTVESVLGNVAKYLIRKNTIAAYFDEEKIDLEIKTSEISIKFKESFTRFLIIKGE